MINSPGRLATQRRSDLVHIKNVSSTADFSEDYQSINTKRASMGNLSKVEKKNIKMYKDKLRKHSIKTETTEFDEILDGEENDTDKSRKKEKRKDFVRKPAWRDQYKT